MEAIEDFLESVKANDNLLSNFYEQLMDTTARHYVLRPLPILLCAVMLHIIKRKSLSTKTDLLYADWSMPVFERLLKAPQRFELKRFRIAGIRADLL